MFESQGYLPQSVNALPMPVGGKVIDGFYEAWLTQNVDHSVPFNSMVTKSLPSRENK